MTQGIKPGLLVIAVCQIGILSSCDLSGSNDPKFVPSPYISLPIPPSDWENNPDYIFDDPRGPGVPFVNYPTFGLQINPVTIAQYALVCYDDWVTTKNPQSLRKFNIQADFLIAPGTYHTIGGAIAYPYFFDYPHYELTAPWYSALAQGQVASVLLRKYYLTEDEKLLSFIRSVLAPLTRGTSESACGLKTTTPEGGVWFEEYPSESPSLVLNGYAYALIGLIEYAKAAPDDDELAALESAAVDSLIQSLPMYDTGDWTLYSRYKTETKLADDLYMHLHVQLMYHLHALTGIVTFYEIGNKWATYE